MRESVLEFDEKIVESGERLSINNKCSNGSDQKNNRGPTVYGVRETR